MLRLIAITLLGLFCLIWGSEGALPADQVPGNHVKTIDAAKIVVDLDLPPNQRWNLALQHFGGPKAGQAITSYFDNLDKLVPKAALDLLEWLASDLDKYGHGIPQDLREEMAALAEGLGLDLGMVVALNFLYELRWLAPNANTTGPCDDCVHPGACTSIIAATSAGATLHARNLDWNLPNPVRELTFECQFHKNGAPLYQGACFIGFVGMASAFKSHAFGVTIDERGDGGNLMVDAIDAVIKGAADPTHALRHVFETATTYDEAHSMLSSIKLSAPVYYIVSGAESTQGHVITRDRNSVKSDRALSPPSTWYVLETNYDWDTTPPSYDDRRKYALQYMNKLGGESAVTETNIMDVISTWPVMNNHTSYTTFMDVAAGDFAVYIRLLED